MLNLLFPKLCTGCNEALLLEEKLICSSCRHQLSLACHHKNGDESMKNIFYGKFPLENATALLYFEKRSVTQEILHNLKYRKQEKLSNLFGEWLGAELAEVQEFNSIDLIIPVPLHKQKLKTRGYNQVAGFGKEIAKALQCEYNEAALVKISKTGSQAFRQRIMRFEAEEIFSLVNKEAIANKHILLVDDIVTTGATLEKCALQLLSAEGVKVSIATIAIA